METPSVSDRGPSALETAATTDRPEILEDLFADPWGYQFFQAVRLLQSGLPGRAPVGGFADPRAESVRFESRNSVAFPASEIAALEAGRAPGDPARMTVNFMGLTGPQGVLPLVYSNYVSERVRAGDSALKDFFGIFEHRAISLFYKAWARAHASVGAASQTREAPPQRETDRDVPADWLTRHLLDLVGLGTPGVQDRLPMPDTVLLFYSGLLSLPTRPAAALEQLIRDYFGVRAEVHQFVGAWYPLERWTQCEIGEPDSESAQLGHGAVAGDETWDQQSRVRITLGPLSRRQYDSFLPGGNAHEPLRAVTRFFGDDQFDFEVQLVLARDEVPGVRLGMEGVDAAPLGWSTWLRTTMPEHDPADAVFTLQERDGR
jgi:type VI secretion system protein ImpH